ncbi:MAG: ABC transporter substrate-binding protein [Candidatus Symbiothrix sp.]|jgi:iron complex transport system substrate-binding protein|nr:ABC transporter substrate-binding protein [Candidatus Symbiothrix sp.]
MLLKIIVQTIQILLLLIPLALPARTITDMAKRKVEIPDKLERILPYDFKTNLLLFPFAGNRMIAKAISLRESLTADDYRYIHPEWKKMKEIDCRNIEEVLKMKPQAIVVGSFVDDGSAIETYEAFARKAHIPLIVVDLELMNLDKTMLFLGELLDKPDEAKACADFLRKVLNETAKMTATPARRRVYMANGSNGLRTAPNTSNHAELFEKMRLENVARSALNAQGFAEVSIEQIMQWNPEYIFCVGKGETNPYRAIYKSALWRTIAATRQKQVYFVPTEPFLWFDMPPSINRIPGLIWFSQLFYGVSEDAAKEKIRTFYRLFYRYELTDKDWQNLFKWS